MQVSDYKVRDLVCELSCFIVSKNVWAVQDCCVCQCLHCCHEDEDRDIEIVNIDLISMSVEIASNQCIRFLIDCLHIFETPNTWNLFSKDAMKPGIDAVSVDCGRNEFVRRHLDGARSDLGEGVAHQLQHFA